MFHRLREARIAGLCLCAVVVLANSVGSVAGERFLKAAREKVPLAALKAQLVSAELVVVIAWMVASREAAGRRGVFVGWDWRVLVCALGWVPATWMSTLITARFGTVVKNVVQCISTLATYAISFLDMDFNTPPPMSIPAILLALVVVLSVLTFTLQSCAVGQSDACDTPTDKGSPAGRFRRGITPSDDAETMLDVLEPPESLAIFDGPGPPERNVSWPVLRASASRGAWKSARCVSEGGEPVEDTVFGMPHDPTTC